MFTLFALFYAYPVAASVFVGLFLAAVIFEKIVRWAVPFTIGFVIGIVYATLRLEYASEDDRVPLLHVSQGAAMMVLSVAYMRWEFGNYAPIFSPPDWIYAFLFWAPFLIGFARVIAGLIDVWSYSFRIMPVLMATGRISLAVLVHRYGSAHHLGLYPQVIVVTVTIWLIVTGAARLLIVSGLTDMISSLAKNAAARIRRSLEKDPKLYGNKKLPRSPEIRS